MAHGEDQARSIVYPVPSPSATPLQETFTYDKLGQVKTKVDTGGRTTSYDYDNASRLTTITDALTNETQFTYNARSQMTKVKDELNQEYTFTYDQFGRVLTQTRNSQTMTFTYDAVGNRITREDYNGDDTTYTYDDLNRLTAIAYTGASGENASYTYDDLSRLLTATNAAGTVTFTYNNRGRLATEEDVFGHDLEYTYDAAGNRTALELDNVAHTSYAYDNANRLTTLTDEASNNFTFTYDNANKLTSRVAPNGVTSSYEYDGMSRLKRLKHYTSGATLYDDQFTYNAANQISQIAGLSQTRNYTYDNINRLTAVAVGGSNVETYTYDGVGNRTSSHLSASYTTGGFNRLTATSSATYSYNANGSMTGKTVGSTNWTYGWDRENRKVSAGDGTTSATYQYDALSRRVKRTQGSDVQKYSHDGLDVVLDDINSTITKYQNGPGIDNKFKLATGSTSNYFLQNHLGSSVAVANSSGSITDSNTYDSFGNGTNSSFPNRYRFTGRDYDSLSALQFSRARFYDQSLGRFVSEDPIGLNGGVNTYSYVSNSPVNKTDPLGLYEIDVHFYLTFYLALRNGCFTRFGAMQIAAGNQRTDDDPMTAPGQGRVGPNSTYHALHPGASPGVGSVGLFGLAIMPTNNFLFGRYLHYFQDTYSHAGFSDPVWGHSPVNGGDHSADKTDRDILRTFAMAQATYREISRYSNLACNCSGNPWDEDMTRTVLTFAAIGTRFPRISDINGDTGIPVIGRWSYFDSPGALNAKIRVLGF